MSAFRVYFYDEKGKELSDSRFNGKEWVATGSGIKRGGSFDKRGRTRLTLKTRDPKDEELLYFDEDNPEKVTGRIKGNKTITLQDFPGHRKVGVKVWAPGGAIEKFWLISDEARRRLEENSVAKPITVPLPKNMKPGDEILLYGLPKGQKERYAEALLASKCKTQKDIDAVIKAASADGWHSFRVTTFTPGTKPDFKKTVAATADEKRARYRELSEKLKTLNHKLTLLLKQKLRANNDAKRVSIQKERDTVNAEYMRVLQEMNALTSKRVKSTEAKLNKYINAFVVTAYDPNQPRDQEGSDKGQWVSKKKGLSISGGEPTGGTSATYNAQEKRWEADGISAARIKSLGIPPAWQKVRINPDEGADLQVLGLDAKGRTQYLYSEAFSKSQTAAKFARVVGLRKKIGKLEASTVKDIEAGNDTAAAVRLMHLTGMRPGSDADTGAEKKAHGATNLLKEHVTVSGDTVHYDFIGKKGINIKGAVKDKILADHISRRLATDDGVRLFKTDGGKANDYIKAAAGSDYKVKDLRTLKATSMAASLVKGMKPPKTVREFNAARNDIGDRVSAQLGNTRSMALKAYINPIVFKGWEQAQ